MAAGVGAVVLTVACAAIAASCGAVLLRLWRSGAAAGSAKARSSGRRRS